MANINFTIQILFYFIFLNFEQILHFLMTSQISHFPPNTKKKGQKPLWEKFATAGQDQITMLKNGNTNKSIFFRYF